MRRYSRIQDRILLSGSALILTGFFLASAEQPKDYTLERQVRADKGREYLRTTGYVLAGLGTIGTAALLYRTRDSSDRT